MTHKRTDIRSAVVTLLTNATSVGANVFKNRSVPLWDIPLPCILVYGKQEQAEALSHLPTPTVRKLELAIDIRAEATQTLDDTLDNLAAEVEAVMNANESLSGNVQSLNLQSTEIDIGTVNEKPVGAVRLTYEVIYAQ
jgi:hypothetical protein